MESVCIFADSRGKNLAISNVETKSFPGIKLIALLEKVEKFLDGNDNSNYKTIYIFAGINDLTSRQKSHDYEELIANEELNLRNLFEEIEQMKTKLEKNKSIKIIFATIPTIIFRSGTKLGNNRKKPNIYN